MCSSGRTKCTIRHVLFYYVDHYKVWSSGLDLSIRFYFKILESCVRPILQDGFWVVHIPFVRMVKFQFLHTFKMIPFPTQFCVVLYSLVLICGIHWWNSSFLLYYHIIYICYFMRLIDSVFDVVSLNGVVLCCYQNRFCFSLHFSPFLNYILILSCEISFVCRSKCQ